MAIIQSPQSTGSFDRKQVVRLPKNGIYGGLLARYSLPKIYSSKFGDKEKIALGFVVTHDQAYRQLPHFSGAFCLPANTLFFDPQTHKASNLVGVLYALCGGKKTREEIVAEGVFDWDRFVGRPVSLFIERAEAPDKDGLYSHRVKGIEPADRDLLVAMEPLLAQRKYEKNPKTELAYLVSPAEEYEEGDTPPAARMSAQSPNDDDDYYDFPTEAPSY